MKYKFKRIHKKHININHFKNVLDKFNNVEYVGIAFNELVLFNYKCYTLAVRIENFSYNAVYNLIKGY